MPIHRHTVLQAFDDLLQPARFKDYGPNGLQVEGREEISSIVSGVTASRALIEAHGGKMWAEQNTGAGISVHFTVPFVL